MYSLNISFEGDEFHLFGFWRFAKGDARECGRGVEAVGVEVGKGVVEGVGIEVG